MHWCPAMEEALMKIEEQKEVISRIEEEEATVTIMLQEDYRKIANRSFGQIQSEAYEMVKDLPASDISLTASSGTSNMRGGGSGGNRAEMPDSNSCWELVKTRNTSY